jgi:hypothetical protein
MPHAELVEAWDATGYRLRALRAITSASGRPRDKLRTRIFAPSVIRRAASCFVCAEASGFFDTRETFPIDKISRLSDIRSHGQAAA